MHDFRLIILYRRTVFDFSATESSVEVLDPESSAVPYK